MRELLDTIDAWAAEGIRPGRAVVIRTFGSAPRPEGATLVATADGRLAGSVSGGCVEGAAVEEIQRAIRTGRSRVIRYGISDQQAWDVGLACGGTIDVLVEPAVPEPVLDAARATSRRSTGTRGRGLAVVSVLPPDSPPPALVPFPPGDGAPMRPPLLVSDDGAIRGSLGDPALDSATALHAAAAIRAGASRTAEVSGIDLFVEAFPAPARLVLVGATEAARALVDLATTLGYEPVVIDPRPAFATRERFQNATLVGDWPEEAFDSIGLGPADAVAILSHDPKLDEPAIAEAFRRGARYVGAIGSRRTQADRRARLLEAGVSEEALARLHGPIGLDLGGRSPAETALSILAEIVASRHEASGRPMAERVAAEAPR